jgi:ABC-type bacteriocin/lantibiotic exporter with double-glycine peptidase domain
VVIRLEKFLEVAQKTADLTRDGMEYAVEINDVSKMHKLQHENVRSLKEKALFFRKRGHEEYWALQNVNVKAKPGEKLGIIGANGSGKSALLKCRPVTEDDRP